MSSKTLKSTDTSTLRGRLASGLGANILNPLLTIVIQFGTVPFLLHAWGATKYGDWLILSAVPTYLNLSNLGFGDASGSDMTMKVAAGEKDAALRTFQSSWVLLGIVSATVLLFASVFVWFIPWRSWLHTASLSSHKCATLLLVLAFYTVISQQGGIIESGFRCDGNFALGTTCAGLMRFVEAALATAVGLATGDLVSVGVTYLLVRALTTVVYAALLYQKSPWLRLGWHYASITTVKELAAPALGFLALPLAYGISLQGFTILIGIVLGPIAVAVFSTSRTLSRSTSQILNVVGWTVWPELSRAFGGGDMFLARRLHRRSYQLGAALGLLSSALVWFLGPLLYRIWVGHALILDPDCFHVLIAVTFAGSLWFTSSIVLMSTNSHHRLMFVFLAATVISLLGARFLLPEFGIKGAAYALLFIELVMVGLALRTALRLLGDTFTSFMRAMFTLPRISDFLVNHPPLAVETKP